MKRITALALVVLLSLFSLAPASGDVVCSTAQFNCSPLLPLVGSALAADYTNATTTFSNTAISVNVRVGKRYAFEVLLFLTESTAAEGVKIDFAGGSATATNFVASCVLNNAVGTVLTQANATSAALGTVINIAATTDALVHTYVCAGNLEPSATGTFIVRGAQNTHATGTLTIKRGSFITLQDVS
jgi:hypothetical protein